MASAGKIKGLRGAKLGNPYLRWAFGEAAIIAKRDPPSSARWRNGWKRGMNGNKFKANTVLAIKLARAVYFMLKSQHRLRSRPPGRGLEHKLIWPWRS